MVTLERDSQVNFKTNSSVFAEAKKVFSEKNIDATSAFNLFLQFVADKQDLPFLTDDEIERQFLIDGLQKRIQKNFQEIQNENYVTLDELEHKLLG